MPFCRRPDATNRIRTIPIHCGLADALECPALAAADLGELDHCAGVTVRVEVDESSIRSPGVAGLTLSQAALQAELEICIEISGPVSDVLESFAAGREKVSIDGRGVIALLDQLDLQRSGVRECNADDQA
jgi:hypothetical protein